jgi:hypothetical protein
MDINIPAVLAEVQAASDRYEHALVTNDVEFWMRSSGIARTHCGTA